MLTSISPGSLPVSGRESVLVICVSEWECALLINVSGRVSVLLISVSGMRGCAAN